MSGGGQSTGGGMNALLQEGEYLKCDTPSCDHFEMTPIVIENVGKPCPKCGANILTPNDFIDYHKMKAGINAENQVVFAANPRSPTILMAAHAHGGQVSRKNVEGQTGNPFPNSDQGM
jgi:hypothetical protein